MTSAVDRSKRPYVVVSVMIATFMVAIEATIVATAMPRIVGELGGFTYYSWVFSAFLLAQCTTTVIYGKLADMLGRKPVLVAGILVFLAGSVLCGFAWSMAALVVFRLVQGIGAGAIQPVTMTVIGDLYTIEERARVQGLNASVWATSAVVGPLAGGIIVDTMPWAWIFWINIPLAILSAIGFLLFLKETVARRSARIDMLGALLFTMAIASLLVMLTESNAGGTVIGVLAVVCVVSSALFVLQERRVLHPIISIELWARRLIATSNAATLLAGMALIGLTTVLPIYVQGVLGRSAITAGFTLSMLVLGWPLAVMSSRRFYRLFGIRRSLRGVAVVFPLGAGLLLLLGPDSAPALAGVASFAMGFAMGMMSITTILLVQDSVEWTSRGSATASVIFARSLGNTLGAAALGAVLNLGIAHFGSGALADRLHAVLNQPEGLAELAAQPAVRLVLDQALRWTFWGVVALALLTLLATWLIPVVRPAAIPAPGVAPAAAPPARPAEARSP